MNKDPMKFIIVGSGWRSLFYWRICCAYPQFFQMTAMLCRNSETAAQMKRDYGIPAVTSAEDCEKTQPDFVVVCVGMDSNFAVSMEWMKKGYPVLCETPAATKLSDLCTIWNLHKSGDIKLQIAEQYFNYASYAADIEIVKRGYLGDPYAIDLSAVHEYHAASLIRRILGIGMEDLTVFGEQYHYPVEETFSRWGEVTDGSVVMRERTHMIFSFEGGKTAFYDFDDVQYLSHIRTRHLKVQGVRGELSDDTLRFSDPETHLPQVLQVKLCPPTPYAGVEKVLLGEETVYENPFVKLGVDKLLPQDETAIAAALLGMKGFIENGTEVYPLAEALQDAYVRILMREALESGTRVSSVKQVWAEFDL